jgi:RimJ/RimL family protein N-acetyltransferase
MAQPGGQGAMGGLKIFDVEPARRDPRDEAELIAHVDGQRKVAGPTMGLRQYFWRMEQQDASTGISALRIRGPRLSLRALRPEEIEAEWQAMVTADPMTIADLPEEASFKARLERSGHLEDGWLDLAIDLDGASIGRIQTFVPPGRPLPPGTFEVGIGLRADARGKGYGREALALLTDWLFEHAAAAAVEAPTDPANVAMRTVFERVGWMLAGSLTEFGREWVMYRITRPEWAARQLC